MLVEYYMFSCTHHHKTKKYFYYTNTLYPYKRRKTHLLLNGKAKKFRGKKLKV